MKYFYILSILISSIGFSQNPYSVSTANPFGLPNPEAPKEIQDFKDLIGKCNCKSTSRNKDQSWAEPVDMTWEWKYILNGMAVQDETIKADGKHSGSIRQFIADSSKWYVHYYSSNSPSTTLPTWEGSKKENGNIVLYKKQKAPNGTDGYYRLTFYDINSDGYKWVGEWVDTSEKFVFPTWKIECVRPKMATSDVEIIKKNTLKFSKAFMGGDVKTLVNFYTDDSKIFPNGRKIMEGTEKLTQYWTIPEGMKTVYHKVTPEEIKIEGDTAYDYGYYEGKTLKKDGSESAWKGKYVIVWKKINEDWKIYLDIWNTVKN